MTVLDDVKTFSDKVTSKIIEVSQFAQSNILHEEIRQVQWHHQNHKSNKYSAFLKYDGDWVLQEKSCSFATLMLIDIDESSTLYSDSEFRSKVRAFCTDLSKNLPKVYKEFGFTRKRKLTVEILQQQLENDQFSFESLIYISKLIKKNICVLTVRKTKTTVSYERNESEVTDHDEWILFVDNENENYLKKSTKILKLEEINKVAESVVPAPSKRTKAYDKFIGLCR